MREAAEMRLVIYQTFLEAPNESNSTCLISLITSSTSKRFASDFVYTVVVIAPSNSFLFLSCSLSNAKSYSQNMGQFSVKHIHYITAY